MIRSMTAFGRSLVKEETREIGVEIRSVNGRYLDCSIRLPRSLNYLEEKVRQAVGGAVTRGKVDISITVERKGADTMQVEIDEDLTRAYIEALCDLRDRYGLVDDISVMRVASGEGILRMVRREEEPEDIWEGIRVALDEALSGYTAMREAEGRKTETDIRAKLAEVEACAVRIGELSHEDTVGYRARLEARLRAILRDQKIEPDEGRILTECAIFADRIAVDEELARLRSHFSAFDAICRAEEPSGRKLDFLLQEMNRETNTIGSKAGNAAIAHLVVEMKAALEKIREQVQNIE